MAFARGDGQPADGSRRAAAEVPAGSAERFGLVSMLVVILGVVVVTIANPWAFVADDSLFYLVIARHTSVDGAWTFNGLVPTNGVQPLWQLVTSAVVGVADGVGLDSPAAQLRILVAVSWVLAFFALGLMWRLLGRLGVEGSFRLLGMVVLGACLCGPWGMFASEAHLVAVTLLWLLLLIERWCRSGPSAATGLRVGVASGLMMLSRLDTVWVAAVAFAVLVLADRRSPIRVRLRALLPAIVTATALLLLYLVWNMARFGHLAPISGAIKVDLTSPRFAFDGVGLMGLALLAAIWIGGAIAVLRPPRDRSTVAIWLVPAVGATVSSAFYFCFSQGSFTQWNWYFVPHAVSLALTAPLFAARLARDRPSSSPLVVLAARLACVAIGAVAVAVCLRHAFGLNADLDREARTFSARVPEVVPDGAVVAAVDLPGTLGVESGRPVLGLDGLTGDYELQDSIRDDGMACTLRALDIRYVVTVDDRRVVERDDGSITLSLGSWLHREPPTDVRARGPLLASSDGRLELWMLEPGCESP